MRAWGVVKASTATFRGNEATYLATTYQGWVTRQSDGNGGYGTVTYRRIAPKAEGAPMVTGHRLMTQAELKKACNGCWVRFERVSRDAFGPVVFLGSKDGKDHYMVISGRYKRCTLRIDAHHA